MAAAERGRPAAYFDERAARYDRAYDGQDADGHALRARMSVVLRLLGPGPGDVLDAGMGPGRLCAELERRDWTVSGIDASDEMVAAARRRLPEAAPRLLRAEIEAMPFEPASFDAVVATGVLEYSEVPKALAELARILRPGGRMVVSYPNPHAVYAFSKIQVYYPVVRLAKRLLRRPRPSFPRGAGTIPRRRFEALLRAHGLEPVATEHASFLPVPAPLDIVFPRVAARLGRRIEGRGPAWLSTQVVYAARKP
jgi:SAM-dependent methyltransferase